jgi:predicted MPP superfamily phosphohydrolase
LKQPLEEYMSSRENAATSLSFRDGLILPAETPAPRRGPWLQVGSVQGFEWNQHSLAIEGLPGALAGLRIVHLSDAHLRPRWFSAYDELISRLRDDPPDLILSSGDFIDHHYNQRPTWPILERLVTQMPSRLGFYAITGNHDGDLLGPRLAGMGINLINRRYVKLQSHDAAIELIGLPGVKRYSFDPHFVAKIPPREIGVPRIVIGHFPDQIRLIASLQADALLTGHTHGGQICLPGGRALVRHDSLPRRMASGAHRVGDTTLIVNRGFGFTRWPIRIFCPAEIIELKLVRSAHPA